MRRVSGAARSGGGDARIAARPVPAGGWHGAGDRAEQFADRGWGDDGAGPDAAVAWVGAGALGRGAAVSAGECGAVSGAEPYMTAAPKSVIPSLRSGQALSGAAGDRAGPGEAHGFVDEGGGCPEGARRRR